jgi:hypothetical protein
MIATEGRVAASAHPVWVLTEGLRRLMRAGGQVKWCSTSQLAGTGIWL